MFSGIVDAIGLIQKIEIISQDGFTNSAIKKFTILCDYENYKIGESIAVNGACLTVTHFNGNTFSVTAVPETLQKTNLNFLREGEDVNLERSLQIGSRLGGHFVQGHIDTTSKILKIEQHLQSEALLIYFSIPYDLTKYIVPKGFVTIDGMSLTVIQADLEQFTVTIIPHTQVVTISKHYQEGTIVNLEVDVMGKYIERLNEVYQHAKTN